MKEDWKTGLGHSLATGVVVITIMISLLDILHAPIFMRETVSIKAQVYGQDLVNLFLAVPATIYVLQLSKKGSIKAKIILTGLMAFFAYTFLSYNILFKLNDGFLLYTAGFGLSLYATLVNVAALDLDKLQIEVSPPTRKWAPVVMAFMVLVIAVLWTPDIIYYYSTGLYPDRIIAENIHTLAIHFQDLSIVLPLALITIWLLRRDEKTGYILAPIVLVKALSIALGVLGMITAMHYMGTPAELGNVLVFIIASLVFAWYTHRFLNGIKVGHPQ